MNIKLMLRLSVHTFSWSRHNMRFFNLRRVIRVVLLFPFFLFMLLLNQGCLWLDELLFPRYRHQCLDKVVFIIAIPRSGTTYLHHLLAADTRNFSSFSLWELIFAPSICQKLLFTHAQSLDRRLGYPSRRFIQFLDGIIFGAFRTIHLMGLNLPEEDETLLLWDFSSVYLSYFFPGTDLLDDYLWFDRQLEAGKKDRIMRFYRACIQRHNYVFNRDQSRYYLSKSPSHISKAAALYEHFPGAKQLALKRCPRATIPSTIALNDAIYSAFTSIPAEASLKAKTQRMLIDWYQMGEHSLRSQWKDNAKEIDFLTLISKEEMLLADIYDFLGLEPESRDPALSLVPGHKSRLTYERLSPEKLKAVLNEIPFMQDIC